MTNNIEKNRDRFVRWQAVLRDHVTFLNNLLLTIAIAIVGYSISLLQNDNFNTSGNRKIFFTVGLIFLFISIVVGLITSLSRLIDFRTTVKKIKAEIEKDPQNELTLLKTYLDLYGQITWALLKLQVITFVIGAITLTIALASIYSQKLF